MTENAQPQDAAIDGLDTKPEQAALDTHEVDADQEQESKTDDTEGNDSEQRDDDLPKKREKSRSARYREKIERQESRIRELQEQIEGRSTPESKPPKLENFDDYDSYESALRKWDIREALKEDRLLRAKEEMQIIQGQRIEDLAIDHQSREMEARKVIYDYDKVTVAYKGSPPAPHVAAFILESDKSALLKYHLATNPQKMSAINRLDPVSAARAIGRLEASLSYPTARTETKAPPPSGALKGGSSPSKSPSEMTYAEFCKFREAGGKII